MQKKKRSFLRAEEGVTAVEFAMISPILVFLIMASIETSLVMFAQNMMESATYAASRLGKTGFVESNSTREQTIRDILEQRAGSVLDMSLIDIGTLTYTRFDQVGDPEPYIDANGNHQRDNGENYTDVNGNGQYDTDMGSEGLGNAGEIVVYTVSYPWQIHTPMIQRFLGQNGTLTLSARAVIQNEPF